MPTPTASYKVVNLSLCYHEVVCVWLNVIAALILKRGTSRSWVVSFTRWTFYSRGKELLVAIEKMLSETQVRSGSFQQEKKKISWSYRKSNQNSFTIKK